MSAPGDTNPDSPAPKDRSLGWSSASSFRGEPASRLAMVQRLAADFGLIWLGVAPAQPSDRPEFLRAWLQAGKHGQMDYLATPERLEHMLDLAKRLPGVKSVICVALPHPQEYLSSSEAKSPLVGRIARYAWMPDYHQLLKKKLHRLADELRGIWPDHRFISTVDTAAILEREHAARAGLGWIGKNTMLIHPRRGSYFLLGEIITTIKLQTAADLGQTITNHCGACTACLDACPTHCLTPYEIDASRCVSYLTIEHQGPIDEKLHSAMGHWLAGCDVCQEVCPFNLAADSDSQQAQQDVSDMPRSLPILDVLVWNESDRRRAVQLSALKRIKLEQFRRNAIIIAGNLLREQDDPALRRRIQTLADDPNESETLRQTARQVLARL